jgi:hypothetical protein
MILAIGADHGGYRLKEQIVGFVGALGHEVHDLAHTVMSLWIIRTTPGPWLRRSGRARQTGVF